MKKNILILLLIAFFSCQEDEKTNTDSDNLQKAIKKNKVTNQVKDDRKANEILEKSSDDVKTKSEVTKAESVATYQVKSISELWKQYKNAKTASTKFIAENNLDSIIVYLNIAAEAAYELSRKDIATWQLNNIGHFSIIEFKKTTDYDNRIQKLVTIKNLKEKGLHTKATKNIFKENYHILTRAENYLNKAQLLDSQLKASERTETIKNNLQFIDWVGNYINNGKRIRKEYDFE